MTTQSKDQTAGTEIGRGPITFTVQDASADHLVGKPLLDANGAEVGTITAVENLGHGLSVTAKLRDDLPPGAVQVAWPSAYSISGTVQEAFTAR